MSIHYLSIREGQAIDLFDALYGTENIEVILPRHEQGLVHAADGYARSIGKTGGCFVTSGPGATSLVAGIATQTLELNERKKLLPSGGLGTMEYGLQFG